MKKVWSVFLILLSAALVLTSCGGGGQSSTAAPDNSQAGESAGTSTAQPAPDNSGKTVKDTIVYAQGNDVSSLDPHVGKQLRNFAVSCNIYDRLVKFDENKNIVGELAESWKFIADDTVQFKLRQGVKFHNGDDLTSADVVFTFNRAMTNTIVKNNFSYMVGVEAVDDYTVNVITDGAYSPVLSALTIPPAGILPKTFEGREEEIERNPIGSGPYMLQEWKEGEYIKLTAFEDYWAGAPKTKNLEMRIIPENSQRTILLETGEIDVAYDILTGDVSRLNSTDGLKAIQDDSFKVLSLTFYENSPTPALHDARVRRAIEMAINKQVICDSVMYGTAKPVHNSVAIGAFGYNPDRVGDPYDVEAAKQLLAEAGYADGFTMEIATNPDQVFVEVATVIQNMLLELNIDVKINTMEQAVLQDKQNNNETFDTTMGMFNNLFGDADYSFYSLYASESNSNHGRYSNPEFERILLASRAMDNTERKVEFDKLIDILMTDRPQIALFNYDVLVGIRDTVEGFTLNPVGAHRYENVVVYE